MDQTGAPIYHWPFPSGFFMAVEFKPGESHLSVGKVTYRTNPNDRNVLPDFQAKSDEPLGMPTLDVCDAPPGDEVGGVPADLSDGFGGTQFSANAINDLSCRFDARSTSGDACTNNQQGNPSFVMTAFPNASTIQFCTFLGVGSEIAFPTGTRTRITARARDIVGQPGPAKSMIVEIE